MPPNLGEGRKQSLNRDSETLWHSAEFQNECGNPLLIGFEAGVAHNRPSPEIFRSNTSMDFESNDATIQQIFLPILLMQEIYSLCCRSVYFGSPAGHEKL